MPKMKSVAGYAWAIAALFVVFTMFLGSNFFSRALVSATGMKVSPWWTGGEVLKTTDHGSYRTLIHRPVFDGLLGQRREGFIQINWEPLAGMPPVVEEAVDYDGDSKEDFSVRVDTKTGENALVKTNPLVMSIEKAVKLDNGWVVRVLLKNKG
jgi:hypothetical protein